MTNMNSADAIDDSTLTYMINVAARIAQAEIKGTVAAIDTITMVDGTQQYKLNSDAMHGHVFGVVWEKSKGKEEIALAPIGFDGIGIAQQSKTYPAYYAIAGDRIFVSSKVVADDLLFVFYCPRSTEMTGANDTAGMDETDDAAVILLTCSFVCASRQQVQSTGFWFALYQNFKNARMGIKPVTE